MDRGSDRLALITGQVQSIPASPQPPSRLDISAEPSSLYDEGKDDYRHPLLAKQSKPKGLLQCLYLHPFIDSNYYVYILD